MSYSKTSVLERAPEWHRADKTSLVDFNEDGEVSDDVLLVLPSGRGSSLPRFGIIKYAVSIWWGTWLANRDPYTTTSASQRKAAR
jgi:hypothetical protein